MAVASQFDPNEVFPKRLPRILVGLLQIEPSCEFGRKRNRVA
jgi:hypothetical protein